MEKREIDGRKYNLCLRVVRVRGERFYLMHIHNIYCFTFVEVSYYSLIIQLVYYTKEKTNTSTK